MVCWCWGLLRFAMVLIWGYGDLLIKVYDGVGICWLICWCGELLSDVYGYVLLLLMWGSADWGLWWCADQLIEVYDGALMWGSADGGLWWCVDVGICWLRFVMVLGSAYHYDRLIFYFNLYTSTCIQISFFAERSAPSTGLDRQVALRLSASHPWPSPADPWPSTLTDTACTAAWYWH